MAKSIGPSNWHRTLLCALAVLWSVPVLGQGKAARVGHWEQPIPWPIIGIHAAVLPTGKVFHLTYRDKNPQQRTAATVWDPADGRFENVSPDFGNMFCSGQNFLSNGELFIAGGYKPDTIPCSPQGMAETYAFNPFTLTWRQTGAMDKARYYPTIIAEPDGQQLIIGGQDESCQYTPTMEIFHPVSGLSRVSGPYRFMRDYPRAFLLSTGEIAQVAPEPVTAILDPEKKAWVSVAATQLGRKRYESSAFSIPGHTDHIALCGGFLDRTGVVSSNPTAHCEAIDLSADTPVWRQLRPMRFPRAHVNAVLLPDGKVLGIGGGAVDRYTAPVLNPELYDPASDTWKLMAPQKFGRMYHATAVLLPDGRVLVAGQDDGALSGAVTVSGAWGEIYSPPYLFKGKRPIVRKAPKSAHYGSQIKVKVKHPSRKPRVVLMGLSAVTHSTNVGQRYVPLESKLTAKTTLRAAITDNPNLAPPGYYMLFVVNGRGVPSAAKMIRIRKGLS